MTIQKVRIKNFKSVVDLSLDLASINVFIGENGSGKSNILEAIAFGGAAVADKLDNEFLTSRGIRVTEQRFMRSAFSNNDPETFVEFRNEADLAIGLKISPTENSAYPRWSSNWGTHDHFLNTVNAVLHSGQQALSTLDDAAIAKFAVDLDLNRLMAVTRNRIKAIETLGLLDFVIYSPEVSALRTFEREGQILPLGVRGEGLLKLLHVLASDEQDSWRLLQENLSLLDWLADVEIRDHESVSQQSIVLRDRFVSNDLPSFDQRSANEGFLYLLFFFALVLSKETPRFFAIENVDTSLNPKACVELMRRLATLAIERKKQILFTTHNPSLLDGLNLHDDNQRLFVVSRNRDGYTTARRVQPPKPVGDELPIKLSEAFTRGLLGGIPQNF